MERKGNVVTALKRALNAILEPHSVLNLAHLGAKLIPTTTLSRVKVRVIVDAQLKQTMRSAVGER